MITIQRSNKSRLSNQ